MSGWPTESHCACNYTEEHKSNTIIIIWIYHKDAPECYDGLWEESFLVKHNMSMSSQCQQQSLQNEHRHKEKDLAGKHRLSPNTCIPLTDTSTLPVCEHRTCNADDSPLCRVQHVARGGFGALDAVVPGQVPGQCVSGGRWVTDWTQVTGALLRCSPDQRPPLGLLHHFLHRLYGQKEKHGLKKKYWNKNEDSKQRESL